MAGTINLAFTQQFDMDGVPLSGGLLYFFTAGTTTPQSAFQDTGLTIVHPNPIVLDASGRVPMFYLADGFIKIRLTDKNGVTVIAADQLLVIGPSTSTGGGGGGTTPGDATQLLSTGDIKARYSTILIDGWVRLNGLTIGKVGSSATERADDTCLPLYTYLWQFVNIRFDDMNAAGIPVKGANALADWNAGRRMLLPDLRGRTISGLDDMGAAAALRLTSTYWGSGAINFSGNTNATTLGNSGGNELDAVTLLTANLPPYTPAGTLTGLTGSVVPSGSVTITDPRTWTVPGNAIAPNAPNGVVGINANAATGAVAVTVSTGAGDISGSFTGNALGDAVSFPTGPGVNKFTGTAAAGQNSTPINKNNAPPSMVLTYYMKM